MTVQRKALTAKVMREEEKRQERKRTKAEKALGEYKSYYEIQEAYGCGVITARQFDRLTELLEESQPEEDELYRAKIELLQEEYQEQKAILDKHLRYEEIQEGART